MNILPSHSSARSESPPRKVRLATILHSFNGDLDARIRQTLECLESCRKETERRFNGQGLDLILLPEHSIQRVNSGTARERAVPLAGRVETTFGAVAKQLKSYLMLPLILEEADAEPSNAVVLFNRNGEVAGIYRKVHPVADPEGVLEGGVAPGSDFPVFHCDFGRLGILICWDMCYPEAWKALKEQGAEIVALSSASPQTIRPASFAMLNRYYVFSSAPRDNVTVWSPIGTVLDQRTTPGVLLVEVDLAFTILHWSLALKDGNALHERFGDRVGGFYSVREDTGVFWSNDPGLTIGEAARSLCLREMVDEVERSRGLQDQARGCSPPPR